MRGFTDCPQTRPLGVARAAPAWNSLCAPNLCLETSSSCSGTQRSCCLCPSVFLTTRMQGCLSPALPAMGTARPACCLCLTRQTIRPTTGTSHRLTLLTACAVVLRPSYALDPCTGAWTDDAVRVELGGPISTCYLAPEFLFRRD